MYPPRIVLLFAALLCGCSLATAQTIVTLSGNGTAGYGGDGLPAAAAMLHSPFGVATDTAGNVYIADRGNHRVRKINTAGIMATLAGNGTGGYSGDGGPATDAALNSPTGMATDRQGNCYIADLANHCIRKVTTSGTISTICGNGAPGNSGDGGPATAAQLNAPRGVAVDTAGILYIADQANNRVRCIGTDGIITTLAGTGTAGYSGDGGPAHAAQLHGPYGVAADRQGNVYIADVDNQRIRKVSPDGTIHTVAGNGTGGYSGDWGPATAAALYEPIGVAVDTAGTLYIADGWNARIRIVAPSGTIHTLAGNGVAGYSGDGGGPEHAQLHHPYGVAVSVAGGVYIADHTNHRVRHIPYLSSLPAAAPPAQLLVYPCPATGGDFYLNLPGSGQGTITLLFTDLAGRQLEQQQLPGGNLVHISTVLPPGSYCLTAHAAAGTWQGIVVLQ